MRRALDTMRGLWRKDLAVRDAFTESGDLLWALIALLLPFGWAVLLWQLEPVRLRVRSLRGW